MLVPQAGLAVICLGLGIFPGLVLATLGPVVRSLPGFAQLPAVSGGSLALVSGLESFDYVRPGVFGVAILAAGVAALLLTWRRGAATRRVPTWGCGGELTSGAEYTATAFSKPLMLIFAALYRPNRQVDTLTEASPYFTREVRYHAEIEPTFERHVYEPLVRAILRVAGGMKVLQAGSLHAYLGYVIAMVVTLVLYVWWNG
jgi:hydrogenase-4 component B